MVRHDDQYESQPDAALHWDTIRLVLLKAFAKHGAPDFSEKHRLRHIQMKQAVRVLRGFPKFFVFIFERLQ